MIISRGRRYVFVHIPKTAGTAVTLALESRAMKDDILIADTPKAKRRKHRLEGVQTAGRLWKHSRLSDVVGMVSEDEISDFFVFTLVRNPWDRVVSYYHWLRAQDFDHQAVALAQSNTFSDFLNHPHTTASLSQNDYMSYVSLNGVDHCNCYVRVEHMAADLAPVETHLGLKLTVGRANDSARDKDYRPYYTDADARHIAQTCVADTSRFGYHFEGPSGQSGPLHLG